MRYFWRTVAILDVPFAFFYWLKYGLPMWAGDPLGSVILAAMCVICVDGVFRYLWSPQQSGDGK